MSYTFFLQCKVVDRSACSMPEVMQQDRICPAVLHRQCCNQLFRAQATPAWYKAMAQLKILDTHV